MCFLLKMGIFNCYVSLPEGKWLWNRTTHLTVRKTPLATFWETQPFRPETKAARISPLKIGPIFCPKKETNPIFNEPFRCELLLVSGRVMTISWNAKCPIFLGNFTPKTSNFCLENKALGFPGISKKVVSNWNTPVAGHGSSSWSLPDGWGGPETVRYGALINQEELMNTIGFPCRPLNPYYTEGGVR